MHIDLDETAPQTFHSTVCIVGAGIAGLTLSTRLAARGVEVHLLEAGGLEQEERSQALFAAEQSATPHLGVSEGRFRTFGGSSTRWGGQLLPFTEDIFTPDERLPSRPWPIAEADLSSYYADIEAIFHVDSLPFDAALLPLLGHPPVPFSPEITLRFSKWAPFTRRNLAHTLGRVALQSPKCTVFSHANAAELLGSHGKIAEIRVLNYSGAEFRFTAQHFIVAAGTVESSRLLLSSAAVPNPHDQLGRFFHDHLSFQAARFTSPQRESLVERLGPFFVDGTLHTVKLEASAASRERDTLLPVMAHIVVVEPEDSGAAAMRNLLRSLQAGKLKHAFAVNLLPMLRGVADILRLLFYARVKRRRAVSKRAEVLLNIDVEQAASPHNRIRLSTRRDALGLPIAIVDWRVNAAEQQTARRFASIIRRELEAVDLAPAAWDDSIVNNTPPTMLDTYHAMGGLSMGDDPATSVVDPDLRVHQLENLHIASCAVFPSGSSSNPTFTMMALTMRLADHLVHLLGRNP